MHHRDMFGLFKGCRLARMSSGRYCVVRDLGLVKFDIHKGRWQVG